MLLRPSPRAFPRRYSVSPPARWSTSCSAGGDGHVVLVAEFCHVLPGRQGKSPPATSRSTRSSDNHLSRSRPIARQYPRDSGHADRQEHGTGTVRACQVGHRANPPEQSGHRIQLRLLEGFAPGMPPEEHRVPEEVQFDPVQVIALADLPDFTERSFPRRRLTVIDSEPGAVRRPVLPRPEQAVGMVRWNLDGLWMSFIRNEQKISIPALRQNSTIVSVDRFETRPGPISLRGKVSLRCSRSHPLATRQAPTYAARARPLASAPRPDRCHRRHC